MPSAKFKDAARRIKAKLNTDYEQSVTAPTAGPVGSGKLFIGGQVFDGDISGVTQVVNVGRPAAAQYAAKVGGGTTVISSGGSTATTGGTSADLTTLYNASYITVEEEAPFPNARQISSTNAITITDNGPSGFLIIGMATPPTLSATSTNDATTGSHAITASAAPGAAESLLKSTSAGLLTLPLYTATTKVTTPLIDTASGNLSIAPASSITAITGALTVSTSVQSPLITTATDVDLVINPAGTGAVQFPNDQTLRTSSFDSSFPITGWQINEVAGISGYSALTIGKIQADELAVRVFVADEVRVDRGDEYWTKSYGIVAETFTTPSAIGSTVSVMFEDSPALAGAIFTNNDWVLIRKLDIDTGISLSNIWGQVATYVNNSDGTQNWTFTLRSGPTSESITKGSLAIDFGATGAALIHLSVIDAAGAPYIKMRKWSGANPYTPSNFTTYVQLGELGSTGNSYYTPSGYGLYIRSTANEDQFIVADDNGLQIRGADLALYNSTTQTILMNNAAGVNILEDVWGSWDNRRAMQWWPNLASMTGDPSLSMYTGKHSGGSFPNQNWAYIDSNPTGGVLANLSITAHGQGTADDAGIYIEGGSQSLASPATVVITAENIDLAGNVDTASLSVGGIAVSLSGHTHSYLPLSGGILGGSLTAQNITFSTDSTYDIGAADKRVQNLYAVNLHVNTIVGTPSYSHNHAASDINSGTLDEARINHTWTGALTLDADASAGSSNYLRLATQTGSKFWDLIGRAHDYGTSAQQNDLLLTYYDGSSTYIVLQADNATRIVDFLNTPTVGGTAVSLSGHTHTVSARDLTSSNRYYPENYSNNVQSAIDAAASTGGTVVLSGFYSISAALSMKSNVTIEGIGWDKSGINTTGNIDAIVFDGPAYKRSMTLRNFKINLGSSTGHHIHFTAYEPWAVTVEDMQLTGGTNSFIKVDTDVNPFEVTIQRVRLDSSTLTNPAIDWLGGGSGCTMDRLYIEPGSGAYCEGLHLYNGNFTIGTIITGNGVHRAVRVEYARANIELIHYEPVTALSSHATDIVRTGTGITIGWVRVGGVVVASGLAGNSKPYYVYYVGHETPASEFGPVQLYSSLETGGSIVYCPDDKSQSEVQLYHGPQSDIDNNSQGLVVSTGELTRASLLSYMQTQLDTRYVNTSGDTMTGTLYGTGIKQGTAPGGGLLGYSTEFYHNIGMIQNAANPTLSTVAYSYSTPASPYDAFTLDVRGNSAGGVQRQMASMVARVDTTTNNSEIASWSIRTRKSGTLTERINIGETIAVTGALTGSSTGVFASTLTAASDTDANNTFGRAIIGYAQASDTATFSHFDHNSSTNFALAQSAAGATVVNAASGQTISLGNAGTAVATISASGIDMQSGEYIGSFDYASRSTGWRVDALGGADVRYLYADQMHVKTFIADLEQALAGSQVISKSVAVLAQDFIAPYAGGSQVLVVEDLPSASNMAVFEANDIVTLRQISRSSGSLSVGYCFGVVTNYADGSGTQSWTFTRSGTTTYNAITQRGTATSNSTSAGTSITVTKPTGVVSGDVMLAIVTHDGAADTITATGWTIIGTYTSGTDINLAMYYRVAGGAEGANYSFSTASSHALAASIVAYYNVDSLIIDDYSISTNSASTSMTGTTVFGTATANMLVFLGGITNNSAVTPASGMTELVDAGSTGIRVYVAHQTLSASGETGSKVATIAASHASIVGMVALRPTYSAMTTPAGTVTPGTVIEADGLVLDYGVSGNGIYEVSAIDGTYGQYSPYARVATFTTHPLTDGVVRTQMGNLSGLSGASANEYGLYAGSGTIATTAQYLRISTAGVQLNNIPIKLYNAGTQTVNIDSAGTDIWVGPSSADKRLHWNGTSLNVNGAITVSAASGFSGSGYLQVGTGTKDSTLNGFNINSSEFVGQASGVDQVVLGTDGKIKAGAGNVVLDSAGISVIGGSSFIIKQDGTTTKGYIYSSNPLDSLLVNNTGVGIKTAATATTESVSLRANASGGRTSEIAIEAGSSTGTNRIRMLAYSGSTSTSGQVTLTETSFALALNGTGSDDFIIDGTSARFGTDVDLNGNDIIDTATITLAPTAGNSAVSITTPTNQTAAGVALGNANCGSSYGPFISIGYNNNGSTPSAAWLRMYRRDGSTGDLWVDASGNLRIGVASAVTNATDTGGVVCGTQTSSLDTKNIIEPFTDYSSALNAIIDAPLYDFTYKSGAFNGERFTGIVTDYAPTFGMDRDETHPAGKSLNTISAHGYTFAAIKALHARIEQLENQVRELQHV